ncbi:MAG: hypothetical protein GY847_34185 [Proteobacteria bacterium]|nr:hypothetical protein [Pseudomonadota bacterium]
MTKLSPIILAAVVFFPIGFVRSNEAIPKKPLDSKVQNPLIDVQGDPDPLIPHRIARLLTPEQLRSAFYKGTRTERLVALDAAGQLNDSWSVLPYLGALMGARDRQVASRAAQSLVISLTKETQKHVVSSETVPGQAKQLAEQLLSIARDVRLDLDVRTSSLVGIELLKMQGHTIQPDLSDLLEEDEVVIRRAVLATLEPPIAENILAGLAGMTIGDDNLRLRGQAAALLCENALAHGVEAPSEDLARVLSTVLGNAEVPADGIGPIMGCLARFPARARIDLISLARSHPDPAVEQYWKALNKR